jgi:hypothetical protein
LDGHIFNESEMALFFECMLSCARKVLDTADIVREAIFRQLPGKLLSNRLWTEVDIGELRVARLLDFAS